MTLPSRLDISFERFIKMQVVVWPEEGFFQTSHDVLVCIRNQGGRSTCFFCDAFILIIIGLFYCYWWCSRISLGDEEPDQILFIASKKFFFKLRLHC